MKKIRYSIFSALVAAVVAVSVVALPGAVTSSQFLFGADAQLMAAGGMAADSASANGSSAGGDFANADPANTTSATADSADGAACGLTGADSAGFSDATGTSAAAGSFESLRTSSDAVSSLPAQSSSASNDSDDNQITTASSGAQYASDQVMISVESDTPQSSLASALEDQGVQANTVTLVANGLEEGKTLVLVDYASGQDPTELSAALVSAGVAESSEPNYVQTLAEVSDSSLAGVSGSAFGVAPGSALGATSGSTSTRAKASGAALTAASGLTLVETSTSSLAETTNDPYLSNQWGLTSIKAFAAWDSAKTNGEVTVATIDSGVDYDHPDLVNNLILEYAKDTHSEKTGAEAVDDEIGHGTHVAGIIAAQANNGVGVCGVSYNAKVLPVKATYDTAGHLYSADIIEAVLYVVEMKQSAATTELANIRVLNMSLSGSATSKSYESAVNKALDAGIFVVAAVGNEKSGSVTYPAGYDGVVGVSALKETTKNDYGVFDASYSNYGPEVDIAAPGSNIYSSVPSGSYDYKNGTSMATPTVAGAAALLFSMDMTATPAEVENILESTAYDLGSAGRDNYYGYGALDLAQAVDSMGPVDISDLTIDVASTAVLRNGEAKAAVSVKYGNKVLVEGTDYDLTYADNTSVGVAKVTITCKGHYTGSTTRTFLAYVCVDHTWDNGTVIVQPTCTDAGTMQYTCINCGATKTEEIAALGHDWGDWIVTKVATTTSEGLEMRICKRDISHVQTQVIPKISPASTSAVYRLYNPYTSEHLWTTDYHEYLALSVYDWQQEGIAWRSPASSATAVYRLYSPGLGTHHYTSDTNEIYALVNQYGWQMDNNSQPMFYSAAATDSGVSAVLRMYNGALSQHLLTMDANEYNTLGGNAATGWSGEGVSFYAYAQ